MKFKILINSLVPFTILLLVAFATIINNREANEKAMAQGDLGPNPLAPFGVRFINEDIKRNEILIQKMIKDK